MIFLAVPMAEEVLCSWVCDCRNEFMADVINETRANPSPDASLSMEVAKVMECEELDFYNPN